MIARPDGGMFAGFDGAANGAMRCVRLCPAENRESRTSLCRRARSALRRTDSAGLNHPSAYAKKYTLVLLLLSRGLLGACLLVLLLAGLRVWSLDCFVSPHAALQKYERSLPQCLIAEKNTLIGIGHMTGYQYSKPIQISRQAELARYHFSCNLN